LQGFSRAADGARTHDLLHGKQYVSSRRDRGYPCKSADFCAEAPKRDVRRLPAITGDSANQLQTVCRYCRATRECPEVTVVQVRWETRSNAKEVA
jgi:hypothetical protein